MHFHIQYIMYPDTRDLNWGEGYIFSFREIETTSGSASFALNHKTEDPDELTSSNNVAEKCLHCPQTIPYRHIHPHICILCIKKNIFGNENTFVAYSFSVYKCLSLQSIHVVINWWAWDSFIVTWEEYFLVTWLSFICLRCMMWGIFRHISKHN